MNNANFFEECPLPNDNQKKNLSRKLGLEKCQVQFWFQNKKNQTKVHNERSDNTALRFENQGLKYENRAFSEALKYVLCPACDIGEEARRLNVQKLRRENSELQKVFERISNEITSKTGKPVSHLLSLPPESLERMSLPAERFVGQEGGNSCIGSCINPTISFNLVAADKTIEISEHDKILMVQKAGNDLNELIELLLENEPLWVMSPIYGGHVLHYRNYYKRFPKSRHLKCMSSQIESSRDLAVVSIGASDLVEMFQDTKKWAYLFPTIVMEAKILGTLNTGNLGGSLHLYKRTHILSSRVAPREFVFLRYCERIGSDIWLIADASYDYFIEIYDMMPTRSWMFSSGLMIAGLPNGKTMVTWVNHVEVDESLTDPLYKDLIFSVHGYGAKRWLSTLERMVERSQYSFCPAITSSPKLDEGLSTVEGRKSIMALSNRMIREFCSVLSMPERLDLSEFSKYMVRISVYDNNGQGQPHCMIVAASTSVWLSLTLENVFNFLRAQNRRPEWDLMLNRSPVNEIARMPTGIHPGNCLSVIKPCNSEEQNKVLLQKNSNDPLGAIVIFSSIETEMIKAVMNDGDSGKIPILPCGFLISSNRGPTGQEYSGASTSTGSGSMPLGSLLTLAFQLEVRGDAGLNETQKAGAKTLNSLVISIIKILEAAFGCTELD